MTTGIKRPWDDSIEFILTKVLAHEGGFVNHPADPGGATNKGITFKTYKGVYGSNASMRRFMQITDHEAKTIYWRNYICNRNLHLLTNLALKHIAIDFCLNSGPKWGLYYLRKTFSLPVNGVGSFTFQLTLDEISRLNNHPALKPLCERYLQERTSFLYRWVSAKAERKVFQKGLYNRMASFATLYKIKTPVWTTGVEDLTT